MCVEKILETIHLLYMFHFKLSCVHSCLIVLCVLLLVVLCVLLSYNVLMRTCTTYVLPFLLSMPDCWLEVSIRKVQPPATSTQVFLGILVSISKC